MVLQTREQRFAQAVRPHVEEVRADEANKKKYGSMCHKLPILIRTAGLAQALAFVEARGQDIHHRLLADLAAAIQKPDLVEVSRKAPLIEYMRLTTDCLDALLCFKRYAQSILDVDAATADTDLAEGEAS